MPIHRMGAPTTFTFLVTRTENLGVETMVDYLVGDGDVGIEGVADRSDFVGGEWPSGKVTFAVGQAEAVISVDVAADANFEFDEAFPIKLLNPVNGTIIDGEAEGVILNDDLPSPNRFQVDASFLSEDASFRSSFGIYDTHTLRATLLEPNVDVRTNPGIKDFQVSLEMTEDQLDDLAFFLIPNGDWLNARLFDNVDDLDLIVERSFGQWRIKDMASDQYLRGTGAAAWFSEAEKNRDGLDHTRESGDERNFDLGWEDLRNLGDRDFNDAVFVVEIKPVADTDLLV